jgi:hypothetical protein
MNIYSAEEIERIEKIREVNDRLEEFFADKRAEWNKNLEPLFNSVRTNINKETAQYMIECQSDCVMYRQLINEQISNFLNRRSKQDVKLKKIRQDKFLWYATSFGVKTNMGEKTLLIEGHVAEEQRNIELIENFIEFLRSTSKNLEGLQFTIKNIIELNNILGR